MLFRPEWTAQVDSLRLLIFDVVGFDEGVGDGGEDGDVDDAEDVLRIMPAAVDVEEVAAAAAAVVACAWPPASVASPDWPWSFPTAKGKHFGLRQCHRR